MHRLIADRLDEIRRLCADHDVRSMYVFGSASDDTMTEDSDIDLLISFNEMSPESYADHFFSIHSALEKLLNRRIDLVTDHSLSNPFFIAEVERTRQLLYAA